MPMDTEAVEPAGFMLAQVLERVPWIQHGFGTRQALIAAPDLATAKQIHSNLVLTAAHPGPCGEGDALVTNCSGVAVSVRTADCYPILLVDTRRRAVAAVHAGWRGTVTHIIDKALENMHA